ncbi:uncharacterized protein B0T23DRAFT_386609 [Neurospora hispaniola]|uniref:Uncharacterized protein n=1 Tax=Neurospora hispaniola TaxID=588809 RepID=A0AAJ0MNR0_9PEZI|nr:hypothetical protein B0T23DRAFT_386609 [Neurospora hispaniola]
MHKKLTSPEHLVLLLLFSLALLSCGDRGKLIVHPTSAAEDIAREEPLNYTSHTSLVEVWSTGAPDLGHNVYT